MEIIIESANIPMNVTATVRDDHLAIEQECEYQLLQAYPKPLDSWNHLNYIQFAVFSSNPNKQLIRLVTFDSQKIKRLYSKQLTQPEVNDIISLLLDHFEFCPLESIMGKEKRIAQKLVEKGLLKIVDETYEKA